MLLGYLIPFSYIKFIDRTQYLIYESVTTDKQEYNVCSPISLHIHRTALIDLPVTINLTLYMKNDGGVSYQHLSFDAKLTKGPREFDDQTLTLPCNLPPGVFYFHGTTNYQINHVDKSVSFDSNTFNIKGV